VSAFQHLWIALDNCERLDALMSFTEKLFARVCAMDKSIADVKAEIQKVDDYLSKWMPWHQQLVDHHTVNPPASITDLHAKVASLFARVEAEGNKAGVALGLFTPPAVEPKSPVEEPPAV
jgi:hypothetical protein